jgi:hypothetical protein
MLAINAGNIRTFEIRTPCSKRRVVEYTDFNEIEVLASISGK